jgi:hypothetical protein
MPVDFTVDHLTGNLTLRHTDLHTGGKDFPYSLPFTRFFNNKNVATITECGRTWSHNYYITATIASDPYAALGQQTAGSAAYNALGTLIAILQLQNNFNPGSPSNVTNNMGFIMSYMTANQLTKLLTNNVVNVSMGDRTYTFTKLSNGSYAAPKGVSMTLVKTANFFVMESYEGVVYTFTTWAQNTTRIASIVYPNGITVNFTYTGTAPQYQLSTVTNNVGKSLTFTYKLIYGLIPYLATVKTENGLTASYTYDPITTGNLLSTIDGGGIQSTYTYDTKYRMLSYSRLGNYSVTYNDQNQVITMSNPVYEMLFNYARAPQGGSLAGGGVAQSTVSGGPNGNTTTNFNADGQPILLQVGSDVTSYLYDQNGRTSQQTLPYGDVIQYQYDEFNRVTYQVLTAV